MAAKKGAKMTLKLLILIIIISLCTGLVGGIITNEYVVAYFFNKFVSGSEELGPIVKNIIEERVFVEESEVKEGLEKFKKSIVREEDPEFDLFGEIVVTSDGVVMNFTEDVDSNYPFIYKKLENKDMGFFKAVEFADLEKTYKGQQIIGIGFNGKGEIIVSKGVIMQFQDEKSTIMCGFVGGEVLKDFVVINLGGELIGVGGSNSQDTPEDVKYIHSVKVLRNLLEEFE